MAHAASLMPPPQRHTHTCNYLHLAPFTTQRGSVEGTLRRSKMERVCVVVCVVVVCVCSVGVCSGVCCGGVCMHWWRVCVCVCVCVCALCVLCVCVWGGVCGGRCGCGCV